MPDPSYEIERAGHAVVVRFQAAEVSHILMQELCQDLGEKLRFDNLHHFVLDLSEVRFLPSACLGAMVDFVRELEHVRGRLVLAGCSENVAFIFRVTRLDTVFPLYDDVEDALAAA